MKEEIIEILKTKNSDISLKLIEVIDIFEPNELVELKIILEQQNPEKLKEALLYKYWLLRNTLDKIITLQRAFHEIKEECEKNKKENENKELDDNLDNLLNNI